MKTYQLVRVVTYVRYVQAKNQKQAEKQLDAILFDNMRNGGMEIDGWEDYTTEVPNVSADAVIAWQNRLDSIS